MTDRIPPRRHITLPGALFPEIDEYRYANQIETRTEAIERLIRAGLDAAKRAPSKRRMASAPQS